MCHGNEMKWWKSEKTDEKKMKATHQDKKTKAVREEKVEEKELIPAE